LKRIRRLDGRIFDKDELIFREKPYGNRLALSPARRHQKTFGHTHVPSIRKDPGSGEEYRAKLANPALDLFSRGLSAKS
jgi:hypothetical protein